MRPIADLTPDLLQVFQYCTCLVHRLPDGLHWAALVPVFIKSALRPSRMVRKQDPSKGLSDSSHLLHFAAAIGSSSDVAPTIFRMAIRFGLPESVALLFQDFGFVHDWDPGRPAGTRHRGIVAVSELDANRDAFEKRKWTQLHILMMKAFIWRSETPFTSDLEEMGENPGSAIYCERNTTPYAEYEKAIYEIVALIQQGQATAADVALVLKWAPMFAEYAVKAGPYSTRSFEGTVRAAQSLVDQLNNERILAGQPVSVNLESVNVPGFLNTIGTSKSFELDEALIKKLKGNAVLKEALAELRIPRFNKVHRTLGRAYWRKFVRNQTLWNDLHVDVLRGLTPDESIAGMKTYYGELNKSPFVHAAGISSRLTTSETFALLFNPYRGESLGRRKRRHYVRPTRITLVLLAELVKAQMRSKIGDVVFVGEDSPEALAYQFNSRRPIQDPAAAFAQILIDSPLPWGDAMFNDLVEMITPQILFESVEQCFIHPKNEVWDERERKQIFGRMAQLLGKVALASPETSRRVVELLSELHHALPDEALLSAQKRRIVQHQVKNALLEHELPQHLNQSQLVDILTEHWTDLPARKKALIDLNIDENRADKLAQIGMEWQIAGRRSRAAGHS